MEEQSEALHARLTWKDLLRVAESSRSHPHPAQPILEHQQAGTPTPDTQPCPAMLRHREREPQIPNML